MTRTLFLFGLLVSPLAAQTPDSVKRTPVARTVTDTVVRSYFMVTDTVWDTVTVEVQGGNPPQSAQGCPTSGYLRLVNVSNTTGLKNAVTAAIPGDQIRMAAGTYSVGFWTISPNGTQANPITLCGPRTANVQPGSPSWVNQTGDWWIHRGYEISNGRSAMRMVGGRNNVIDSLLMEDFESIALNLDATSKDNQIKYNTIRCSGGCPPGGLDFPKTGEGIYLGAGAASDSTNRNWIHHNTIGPNVTAECLQIRSGRNNIVEDNTCNASGFIFEPSQTQLVWWTGGVGDIFRRNTTTNIPSTGSPAGMSTYNATNALFENNTVTFTGTAGTGYRKNGGSGSVIKCNNVANTVTVKFSPACTP